MDKFQAIQAFWGSFGVPAYEESSVPSGDGAPKFPYITYSAPYDGFNHPVSMVANVWTRSSSWAAALKKFDEIEKDINSGKYILCDGGAILVRFGSPKMNRLGDDADDMVRRLLINIEAEYIITKN
ncbi:MAG: hypothetical protein NC253_05300 [Ruminococcus sp.]|nr:hypothetical protein [Ruminococcus sp.]MCM1380333.1 hypothetical protein [Muribaculaceae bacterium]MCM1478245.1 hypothetical protein [Muribaculaceae bacterium]